MRLKILVMISLNLVSIKTLADPCFSCLSKEQDQKVHECFLENEDLKKSHINEGSNTYLAFFEGFLIGSLAVSLLHK